MPSFRIPRTLLAAAVAGLFAAGLSAQSLGPGIVPAPQPPSREDTSGLTAEIFYRVILGDVALQRGEASLAARAYYEAARDSKDPRLARRAAEVAFAARMRGLTQEAAKLWASLDPTAERPKQMLAAMAASGAARGEVAPIDNDLKAKLEKRSPIAATARCSWSSTACCATRSTSGRCTSSSATSPSRIPTTPRRTSRSRSPRTTAAPPTAPPTP
jgi:hypothetical protein